MDEHEGLRYLYFDVAHAIDTQRWIIENSGGLPGVKNVAQLESVLIHIQNDLYYPEMVDKLTHLVFSINKNHPFNDGNKRSSIGLGAYFLELNGYAYVVRRFVLEMENIAVYVADNVIGKDLLREFISALLYEDDYPESLKLALIEAISSAMPNASA
ncbi:type II toxin-antitoxin system death-on-curing family toxin [Thauera aminoaromatica]|jgi:death-on-curing protein|uniref:Death-on-curing family protein n=1 Tax=Thauera aminoaromatica TaxID=164330 RepID=C4KBJ6_THASP|nr:type II toxin-antitoxin system death-on-curing family toxin [Thauera aminoaromatica]ACR01772.1 death-on-curing family protein [Thauera aminoaromatica]